MTAALAASWLLFLSTLSLRRATTNLCITKGRDGISIHALLAESDTAARAVNDLVWVFLSTLSLRRATAGGPLY